MRWLSSRVVWGVLLIAGGILFLLQNLGLMEVGNLFWTLLFAFAGVSFLSVFFSDRAQWWALIPGFVLLALAAVIGISVIAPGLSENLGGGLFLGGIGLAFFAVYLANRGNWWAVIPGGVLLTLATVATIGEATFDTGGIFFLGLGLTFALVAILPTPEGSMKWAFIPAGILLVMGLLIMAAAGEYINLVWPAALILLGLFLIYRTLVWRRE